jgi:hypothetical protein
MGTKVKKFEAHQYVVTGRILVLPNRATVGQAIRDISIQLAHYSPSQESTFCNSRLPAIVIAIAAAHSHLELSDHRFRPVYTFPLQIT